MPKNTTKRTARHLVEILYQHGVRRVVLSPGSRNTPLIMAFERHPGIESVVVIDERVAAFVALGMSMSADASPVALCCTSGTAPLNYSPALAEAYYRGLPLIAVTADRPEEWIDQDDSQTIRQAGVYANFVKTSIDLPVESDEPDRAWMTDRLINEAMLSALARPTGPVHINVRLDAPLASEDEIAEAESVKVVLDQSFPRSGIDSDSDWFEKLVAPPARVLVLAGFMQPGVDTEALNRLAARPNVVVMREAQSNLESVENSIGNIDATLSQVTSEDRMKYAPDVVVTLGGSLLSRYVKVWLRGIAGLKHVAVTDNERVVDPFRALVARIGALPMLSPLTKVPETEFKKFWYANSLRGFNKARDYAARAEWSDFKAMSALFAAIPEGYDLQLSNGTAVRYAQLFDYSRCATVQCNRGVSGIDGCTSTAVGAAFCSHRPMLLVTGDMSFAYDIGALALGFIPKTFRIAVLNNGGGGIFRFIPSTAQLPELERCFVTDLRLPLADLARGYGFRYLSASSDAELKSAIAEFFAESGAPVILDIRTDGIVSAEILRNFFKK